MAKPPIYSHCITILYKYADRFYDRCSATHHPGPYHTDNRTVVFRSNLADETAPMAQLGIIPLGFEFGIQKDLNISL